jgi:hypothetical protein
MTVRSPMSAAVFSGLVGLGLVFGCGKPESAKPAAGQGAGAKEADTHDHGDGPHSHTADPHDQPITEADVQKPADFKDAVARIMKYREDIEVAAGGDVPGKAHRSLDELDIVLKWLPGIARDSQVPKDQWETINTSAQQLREQFEKVHGNIDNKKNPDFPAVAKAVDEAIARLEAAAAAGEAKP